MSLPFLFGGVAMAEKVEAAGVAAGESAGPAKGGTRADPIVIREFPQMGKYRVRVIRSSAGPRASVALDIREYAKSESFEGFTRRGIRIGNLAEARQLTDALRAIEEEGLLK